MANSVFTGRGQSSGSGSVLISRVIYNHADILAGATPKTVVAAVSGYVIMPLGWSCQRNANASSAYGTNATFTLRYAGIATSLGVITPQLSSLSNKYYAVNPLTGAVFNNTLSPGNTAVEIITSVNSGGGVGTTIITFDVAYALIPVAMS